MTTARTRTTGSLTQELATQVITNCANVTTQSSPSLGTAIVNGTWKKMDDVVTPGYEKLSATGAIVNTAMRSEVITGQTLAKGMVTWSRKPQSICTPTTDTRNGSSEATPWAFNLMFYSDPQFSPSFDLANARTLAGTQAVANIREPDVMGLVDLAEIGKTLRMLRKNSIEFANLFIAARRETLASLLRQAKTARNRRRYQQLMKRPNSGLPADVLRRLASRWLELRYGWTPLLMSIQDAIKALTTEKKARRQTYRGFTTSPVMSFKASSTMNAPSSGGYTYKYEVEAIRTVQVRAGVLVEEYLDMGLDERFGLPLTNVPQAAWELTTLSFVADWFANIGDVISALSPKAGVKVLSSWTTVIDVQDRSTNTTATAVNYTYPTSHYNYSGGGTMLSHLARRTIIDRKPGVDIGLASKLHEIQFVKSRDFIHAADAVALVVSTLRGSGFNPGRTLRL